MFTSRKRVRAEQDLALLRRVCALLPAPYDDLTGQLDAGVAERGHGIDRMAIPGAAPGTWSTARPYRALRLGPVYARLASADGPCGTLSGITVTTTSGSSSELTLEIMEGVVVGFTLDSDASAVVPGSITVDRPPIFTPSAARGEDEPPGARWGQPPEDWTSPR
uniref:Wt4.4c n=1 Tax=uncultured bacterium WT4 TaxID=1393213 RepID=U3Q0Q0_9BACT|nr:Wt4.4c [uncultured bacterium WT4]